MEPNTQTEKPFMKLPGHRFSQADYEIGRYAARPPSETTVEDVLHPQFFANHISALKVGMTITVLSDDLKLDCDVRVESVTKTTARVRLLRLYDPSQTSALQVSGVEIKRPEVSNGGPKHKWRFIHDGEVVQHGFDSQAEAQIAADKYYEILMGV